jgi:hypothetical protein
MSYICEICKRECKNIISLATHLRLTHRYELTTYYNQHFRTDEQEGFCKNCGKSTNFLSLGRGYEQYCSRECASSSPLVEQKKKQTCLDKYGTEYAFQAEEVKKAIRETNISRYGVDSASKTDACKEKSKATTKEKYGKEHYTQTEEYKERSQKTCLKKYGETSPMKVKEIQEKQQESVFRKLGVRHPAQSEIVQEKMKNTCLKLYGYDNAFKNKMIQEKYKETCMKRFGKPNFAMTNEYKLKIIDTCRKRYGKNNVSSLESTKEKLREVNLSAFYQKIMSDESRLKDVVIPLFEEADYHGVCSNSTKYPFKCVKCGNVFEDHLMCGHTPRCFHCYPKHLGISKMEKAISEFVSSLGVEIIENNRSILHGKELDIYIPSHNLAIEFNGLYWHSESMGTNKYHHLNKTLKCKEQGIKLIHIFEDEWLNKKEIVKALISSSLSIFQASINCIDCDIQMVSDDIARLFLNDNCIQGYSDGIYFGLYSDGELVSILTCLNHEDSIEAISFCNKLYTDVHGSMDMLLFYAAEHYQKKDVIIQVDLRHLNEQSLYVDLDDAIGITEPAFHYIKSWQRIHQQDVQQHLLQNKLAIFDPVLSEWENMQLNGYDRIWDCGSAIYSWSQPDAV